MDARRRLLTLFCALMFFVCAPCAPRRGAAGESPYAFEQPRVADLPLTEDWSPPVLTDLADDAPFWLRVLAQAQREVDAPHDNQGGKYALWFSGVYSPWCTEFVMWCVDRADRQWGTAYLGGAYPRVGTATEAAVYYIKNDRYIGVNGCNFDGEKQWLIGQGDYLADRGYLPMPGDILWLDIEDGRDYPDHTTLVEGLSRDAQGRVYVHVIEGNMGDTPRRHAYAYDDSQMVGVGTPVARAHTRLAAHSRYGGVRTLHAQLRQLGYAVGGVPYRLEGALLAALAAFQRDSGLPVTRALDIPTREALDRALAGARP